MDHGTEIAALAVVSACVVLWGLISARLERLDVSAPIFFVVLGLVTDNGPFTLLHLGLRSSTIRSLAEATLALVLFADASRVNAKTLEKHAALPARLLGIGLPLTIGAGFAVATGLFHGAGLWVAAALAAIVAPTDAALGASIMRDERVPAGVRRALNVESGLNDGIVTPFVNLFLAGAVATEVAHSTTVAHSALELLGGAALGAAIGAVGALLLRLSARARWSSADIRPLAVCALALFAYALAVVLDLNGFVAAFVAGMGFGTVVGEPDEVLGFVENAGTLMSLFVWFVFGAVMLIPGLKLAGWRDVVFALLALTVVRMIPVALALIGAGYDRTTVAFIGWFGPRGLASVVFGLLAVDSLALPEAQVVLGAVTVTVALSVLAHGVSASPLAARYGRVAGRSPRGSPERSDVPALSTRHFAAKASVLGLRKQP